MQETLQDMKDLVSNPYSTGLILCSNGVPIGYVSGIHITLDDSYDPLEQPELVKENEDATFYVHSLAILEDHRSPIVLEFLAHEMAVLLLDLKYTYVTAHARRSTGLSILARRYGAQILARLDNWQECNEPFDYILFDISDLETLPPILDRLLTVARRTRSLIKRIPWYD